MTLVASQPTAIRAALLTFLLSGSVTIAAELTRGPYLQLATPAGATIVWRTRQGSAPRITFGTEPRSKQGSIEGESIVERVSVDVAAESAAPFGSQPLLYDEPAANAATRHPGDREPSTPEGTRQYEATTTGLEAGKRYYYAVYDGDTLLAGGDAQHYFDTLPEAGAAADARVWVVGDSGTGGLEQRRVFDAMEAFAKASDRRPDLFVHVGDMAYGDGADVEFQQNFFDIYQRTLQNTVCWPAMGNHEGHTSRGRSQFGPYYDAYVLPTAAEAGGVPSGTEAYYSFDYGTIHFICLDSHDLDRTPDGAMAQWLVADLEETDAEWMIAYWHHPPYTKGSHDSDNETQLIEMRRYIMPLLESGGVDMVLSGHSHIYERSMLIDGAYATPTVAEGVILDDGDGHPDGDGPYRKSAGLEPHNGTIAIVAGHGGAGVSRKGTMPIMREIIVENGSLILDISGDTLTGTMIDLHGAERDRFQLVKRGKVGHAPVANPWQPVHDPSAITETVIAWGKDEAGITPPGWTVHNGTNEELLVQNREGTPYFQAQARPQGDGLVAIYEAFEGRLNELEGYLEPLEGASAGLVLGWRGPDDYLVLSIDPQRRVASFVRVAGDERTVLSERELGAELQGPFKVELEPVQSIVEVQINDEIEYTVNLEGPLPGGKVGVEVIGGDVNFARVTLERAR